jgi:DNA-binding SARP family transcriptional activator/DNA-binding beta-propeller fold protein YncE
LRGAQVRAVLARLLIGRNRVVPRQELLDSAWPERDASPDSLHASVSRLRKLLGEDATITSERGGYILQVRPGQVDQDRFEEARAKGLEALDRGDHGQARAALEQALSLWRGRAYAEVADEGFAAAAVARLEEERIGALEAKIDTELALGRNRQALGELEELVAEHPLREGLVERAMAALYTAGRQADALELYRSTRTRMVEELGLEPGPALRALETAILRHELPAGRRLLPARRRGRLTAVAVGILVAAGAFAGVLLARGRNPRNVLVPSSAVVRLDPATGRVLAAVRIPGRPGRLTSDGRILWVATDSCSVLAVGPDATIQQVIPVGAWASDIAVGLGKVWVVSGTAGELIEVDPGYRTVTDRAHIGRAFGDACRHSYGRPDPEAWSVTVGGGSVWVTTGARTLLQIDPRSLRVVRRIDLGAPVRAVSADGDAIWAATGAPPTVYRIEPDGRVLDRIPLVSRPTIESPFPVALRAAQRSVWTLNANTESVTRIDRTLNGIATTVVVGQNHAPAQIATDTGNALWVADSDGTLARIDGGSGALRFFTLPQPVVSVTYTRTGLWAALSPGF